MKAKANEEHILLIWDCFSNAICVLSIHINQLYCRDPEREVVKIGKAEYDVIHLEARRIKCNCKRFVIRD